MPRPLPFLAGCGSLLLIIAAVYFAAGRSEIYAQMARSSSVSKTSSTSRTDARPPAARPLSPAARSNSQLRRSLQWTFAGKLQVGWEIYEPLIRHAIGSDSGAGSSEFANAVAEWQGRNGLESTGVLESATLQALIKNWQSRRLGKSSPPSDESLISAPISEFFDQTRDPGLLQLERETFAAYKRMLAAAAKDLGPSVRFSKNGELAAGEKFLKIVSAYRSPAYQEALRKKEPNAGRGALAKFSAHATGQALDIYVGGEPVSTKDPNRLLQVNTPAYQWLVKNANRFGFYNYFYEPWHWEYVPSR